MCTGGWQWYRQHAMPPVRHCMASNGLDSMHATSAMTRGCTAHSIASMKHKRGQNLNTLGDCIEHSDLSPPDPQTYAKQLRHRGIWSTTAKFRYDRDPRDSRGPPDQSTRGTFSLTFAGIPSHLIERDRTRSADRSRRRTLNRSVLRSQLYLHNLEMSTCAEKLKLIDEIKGML